MRKPIGKFIIPLVFIGLLYLYFLMPEIMEFRNGLVVTIAREGKESLSLPLMFLADSTVFLICYLFIFNRPYGHFDTDENKDVKEMHALEIIRLLIVAGLSVLVGFKANTLGNSLENPFFPKYYTTILWFLVILMPFFSIINIVCENSKDFYNKTIILLDYALAVICGTFVMFYLATRQHDTKGWFWWCSLFAIVYLGARMGFILMSIDGEGLFEQDNSAASYIKQIIFTVLLSAMIFVFLNMGGFKTFFTVAFRWAEAIMAVGGIICGFIGDTGGSETTIWIIGISSN